MLGAERIRVLRDVPLRGEADYVLYWMIAARRGSYNFALERAVQLAREVSRPVLVLEALRVGYPWASDRLHTFVLEGMADNARHFAKTEAHYYPYVEPEAGAGAGLLEALARNAAAVVTDDYPSFFLPRMVAAAAERLPVRFEAVDGNGILPLSLAGERAFPTAYAFRRFLQQNLERALAHLPLPEPLKRAKSTLALPQSVARVQKRYPPAVLAAIQPLVDSLPIDHAVGPSPSLRGGSSAATACLRGFLEDRLARYAEGRSHPDLDAASGLSPFLHFGHIGVHQIFHELAEAERWEGVSPGAQRKGTREGFWGMSENAEAFLDELLTWRELAFNTARNLPHYQTFGSLPDWAKNSLHAHAGDPRKLYSLPELEDAKTHDPIWNAAQTELLREGRMQNYLRMLWGKKILEWSKSPEEALKRMIHLNNKYAIDGRDPNSYAGIFWVLGRYDRPWAPQRPIFGVIRYMSSDSTRKKLKLRSYLARYGAE